MSYDYHTGADSPNKGPGRITLPCGNVIIHWWGNPSGQDPWGVVNWLCNPASQVSAHAVVWPHNVACIVNYDVTAWANGNSWANGNAISVECDPNHVNQTIDTLVEYLAWMVEAGNLTRDFAITGHRDWYSTECPGAYYNRLGEIRQRVTDKLNGVDDMPSADEIANAILDAPIKREGEHGWDETTLRAIIAWYDNNRIADRDDILKVVKESGCCNGKPNKSQD